MSNEEKTSNKEKTIFEIKKNTLRKNTNCYCQKNNNTKNIEMTLKDFQKACIKHTFQISIALTHILSQNP